MIQNLNPVTFRSFGTILTDKATAFDTSVTLTPEPDTLYRAPAPTALAGEDGSWVLSVSADGRSFRDFYLDKAITLAPGVFFTLTPLQACFPVRFSCPPEAVGPRAHRESFQVRPKLAVQSLYTFFYQEKERGFLFPGETHLMAELTYVDQGSLHSVCDGQDLLLEQGDMVLYGPDQWHMQYADVDVAPRFVTVSFDVGAYPLQALYNRRFRSPRQAIALLKQMLREQENPDSYSEDMLLSLLTQLLLSLLRQCDAPTVRLQSTHCLTSENGIVQRALRYISDNVCTPLSVPTVARNTDISTSYLTALFHKHLQQSPGEYIRRIKLQHSKQLLREGNHNITEIARMLHYSTVHHFSRQFKEKFGITPSQYAKSIK